MSAILDIVGSLAIRGAIVLVILKLNLSLHETLYTKSATASVKQNLATMVSVIDTDIRQVGYNVLITPFLKATAQDIEFLTDLGNDGTVDDVHYYLQNGIVYRVVNGGNPLEIGRGITTFNFQYFSPTNLLTTDLSVIRSIKLSVTMEADFLIDGVRPTALYEFQFWPQNL